MSDLLDADLDEPVLPDVVGLDLSITATGAALAVDDVVETWRMPADLGDRRLSSIAARVRAICAWRTPVLVVIEDLPTHAKSAGITGMVHGAARTALLEADVPYALVVPSTLKRYATGKGNTDKTAMTLALYKRTGLELADDNQVDAWWLRAMGLHHLGFPIVDLPAAQVAAVEVVRWP